MGIGQIAKSAIEVGLAVANKSGEITPERATSVLRAWEAELSELWNPGVTVLQEVTKTVDGKPRPAGDFLVVEDSTKPSTWHLPVKVNGAPDHRLMGGAWAALHGGYRGQKYQGSDKAAAISKLKALYKSEGMETPGGQQEAMFDTNRIRDLLTEALDMLDSDAMESDGHAVKLARDATKEDTATLSEAETAVIEAGRRAPVVIDFQILEPGPGNKEDNHYYPADVVRRDIHVFSGVDVFTTDHIKSERSELTKVGRVLACPTRFTEAKAPVAQVLIYDPAQAEKARNRNDAGALDTLECSIHGNGRAKEGEIDGKKYKIVETITQGRYLDFVSKAGAGGKARNLAESEHRTGQSSTVPGGKSVDEEKDNKADATPVEEVEIEEAEVAEQKLEPKQEQEPQTLGTEVVKEALDATNLPEFVKVTLSERQYKSDDELKEAVAKATAEVKKLSGSGQVTGLGESESAEEEPSLEEHEQRRKDEFNKIMQEVGLREV